MGSIRVERAFTVNMPGGQSINFAVGDHHGLSDEVVNNWWVRANSSSIDEVAPKKGGAVDGGNEAMTNEELSLMPPPQDVPRQFAPTLPVEPVVPVGPQSPSVFHHPPQFITAPIRDLGEGDDHFDKRVQAADEQNKAAQAWRDDWIARNRGGGRRPGEDEAAYKARTAATRNPGESDADFAKRQAQAQRVGGKGPSDAPIKQAQGETDAAFARRLAGPENKPYPPGQPEREAGESDASYNARVQSMRDGIVAGNWRGDPDPVKTFDDNAEAPTTLNLPRNPGESDADYAKRNRANQDATNVDAIRNKQDDPSGNGFPKSGKPAPKVPA